METVDADFSEAFEANSQLNSSTIACQLVNLIDYNGSHMSQMFPHASARQYSLEGFGCRDQKIWGFDNHPSPIFSQGVSMSDLDREAELARPRLESLEEISV